MDKLSPRRRSENMRRIRATNTSPELTVRRSCREHGFIGYRLHRTDLPGKPDVAWGRHKVAVFVHGCFWHGHNCREGRRKPKSNTGYWLPKIDNNRKRDSRNIAALQKMGWKVYVIWECQITGNRAALMKLHQFLSRNLSLRN